MTNSPTFSYTSTREILATLMIYASLNDVTLSGGTFFYCKENLLSRAQNIV